MKNCMGSAHFMHAPFSALAQTREPRQRQP